MGRDANPIHSMRNILVLVHLGLGALLIWLGLESTSDEDLWAPIGMVLVLIGVPLALIISYGASISVGALVWRTGGSRVLMWVAAIVAGPAAIGVVGVLLTI